MFLQIHGILENPLDGISINEVNISKTFETLFNNLFSKLLTTVKPVFIKKIFLN